MKLNGTNNIGIVDNSDESVCISVTELRKHSKYSNESDESLQVIANGYMHLALFLLEVSDKKYKHEKSKIEQ